ncbi:sulfatase [Echinicola marina]|uniref:sulfatase family protein n=1 Tax=Echinicola marina TaxID=2859768 RepID=UPI001CF6D83F|nr:sulfatase [Echinicola marina]UCS92108.1 sulfatase [Echinicola marina]
MNKKNLFNYILVVFTTFLFTAGIHQDTNAATTPPNIIIFFTDDQGYADVGSYGAEGYETPNFDELAANGIRFTDFYVPATVCTPSRAGLLTGRYPKRSDLHEAVLFPYSEGGLAPEEYTMAEMLKASGYTTSCIGKWHLGHKEVYMPNNQGFDEFYGVPYSNDMDGYYYKNNDFQSPPLPFYRNTELIEEGPDQHYLTKRYTEETIRQIQGRGEKPFFIYLAHNMPHKPLYASPEFEGKSGKGIYADVIMELDWSMGEIVKTLKEEGIYDNTIIIFTSDNGPQVGSAKPLRGKKAQTWEGGQRVPGIISWPAAIPAGIESHQFVSTMDLFPTLAHIAGAKIPEDLKMDGMDISKHLYKPNKTTLPERPLYYFARNGKVEAVRLGKWKLHIEKSIGWNQQDNGTFTVSLYNLDEDISEESNVADKYPDMVKKLTSMIKAAEEDIS